MEALQRLWERPECATTGWISYAYEHTAAGSPSRNIAVDQAIYHFDSSAFSDCPDDFPRDMLFKMALAVSKSVIPTDKYPAKNYKQGWDSEGDDEAVDDGSDEDAEVDDEDIDAGEEEGSEQQN